MQPHKPPDRLTHHGPGSDYAHDHERLRELVGAVLSAPDPSSAKAPLEELRASLEAHFSEEEEQDGVFTWLAAMDTSLGPRLRELEADHKRLTAEIEGLIAQIKAGATTATWVDAAKAFGDHLRRHEREENDCLKRAVGED